MSPSPRKIWREHILRGCLNTIVTDMQIALSFHFVHGIGCCRYQFFGMDS